MTRYVVAFVLLAFAAHAANAQPVLPVIPPSTPKPAPTVIEITGAKPAIGYYKSGGVIVGADGYYPFDTGAYLLGGYEGLARSTGTYVMVPQGSSSAPVYSAPPIGVPVYSGTTSSKHGRFFHRR